MTKQFNILGQTYNLEASDMVVFNKAKDFISDNIYTKLGKMRAIIDSAIELMGELSAAQCNNILDGELKLKGVHKFIDVTWTESKGVTHMGINDHDALIEALAIRYMWEAEIEAVQDEFDEIEEMEAAEADDEDEDDEELMPCDAKEITITINADKLEEFAELLEESLEESKTTCDCE